jgi:hypothetical protein
MRDEIAFKVDFERAAPRYRQLPEPVRRILRLCDGTRGLTQVVALSPIDAERTEAVLRRLAQLGIILPGQRAGKAASPAANAPARSTQPAKAAPPQPPAKATAPAKSAASAASAKPAKAKDAPDITTAPATTPNAAAATHEPAQVLAFTHDEEQFFDSPIDHLVTDEFGE